MFKKTNDFFPHGFQVLLTYSTNNKKKNLVLHFKSILILTETMILVSWTFIFSAENSKFILFFFTSLQSWGQGKDKSQGEDTGEKKLKHK